MEEKENKMKVKMTVAKPQNAALRRFSEILAFESVSRGNLVHFLTGNHANVPN